MFFELMQASSPSSSSSNSLCIGAIPVSVLPIGDPNIVPTGISLADSVPTMVETRSGDIRRLEESLSTAIAEVLSKLAASDSYREDLEKLRDQADSSRDLNFKELREEFLALQIQQN